MSKMCAQPRRGGHVLPSWKAIPSKAARARFKRARSCWEPRPARQSQNPRRHLKDHTRTRSFSERDGTQFYCVLSETSIYPTASSFKEEEEEALPNTPEPERLGAHWPEAAGYLFLRWSGSERSRCQDQGGEEPLAGCSG